MTGFTCVEREADLEAEHHRRDERGEHAPCERARKPCAACART
ncbi:hypothetical protein B1M_02690 [Burkholderia sp. TJI49]|nr:hypothetical protein B1M_02690 [Burkholderia sp. TJI49]